MPLVLTGDQEQRARQGGAGLGQQCGERFGVGVGTGDLLEARGAGVSGSGGADGEQRQVAVAGRQSGDCIALVARIAWTPADGGRVAWRWAIISRGAMIGRRPRAVMRAAVSPAPVRGG